MAVLCESLPNNKTFRANKHPLQYPLSGRRLVFIITVLNIIHSRLRFYPATASGKTDFFGTGNIYLRKFYDRAEKRNAIGVFHTSNNKRNGRDDLLLLEEERRKSSLINGEGILTKGCCRSKQAHPAPDKITEENRFGNETAN